MLLGWHPMHYYNQAYGFNQYLANQGYLVLSVNYRSGTGYGMEFREALQIRRFGRRAKITTYSARNAILGIAR